MQNLFNEYRYLGTLGESFFTMAEVLFGSIKFTDTSDVSSDTTYFFTNINLLFYGFTSNILATFLLIAYLSSIYERVKSNASYSNTKTQYFFL